MDVTIDNATNVGHAPFWINFNKDVIEVTGVDQGDFLGKDGKPVQFLHNVLATGKVVVGLSRIGKNVFKPGNRFLFQPC